jgi:hypothetical protein
LEKLAHRRTTDSHGKSAAKGRSIFPEFLAAVNEDTALPVDMLGIEIGGVGPIAPARRNTGSQRTQLPPLNGVCSGGGYGAPYVQANVTQTVGTISVTGSVTAGSRKAADAWVTDNRQFAQGYLDIYQMRCFSVYPPLNGSTPGAIPDGVCVFGADCEPDSAVLTASMLLAGAEPNRMLARLTTREETTEAVAKVAGAGAGEAARRREQNLRIEIGPRGAASNTSVLGAVRGRWSEKYPGGKTAKSAG